MRVSFKIIIFTRLQSINYEILIVINDLPWYFLIRCAFSQHLLGIISGGHKADIVKINAESCTENYSFRQPDREG